MSDAENVPISNRPSTIYGVPITFQVRKEPTFLEVELIVFKILASVAVSLRLYVRLKLLRSPGWDDAVICLAYVRNIEKHSVGNGMVDQLQATGLLLTIFVCLSTYFTYHLS
jgi:hypothetical protein